MNEKTTGPVWVSLLFIMSAAGVVFADWTLTSLNILVGSEYPLMSDVVRGHTSLYTYFTHILSVVWIWVIVRTVFRRNPSSDS
jgi:hypothetical protein